MRTCLHDIESNRTRVFFNLKIRMMGFIRQMRTSEGKSFFNFLTLNRRILISFPPSV